MQHIKGDGFTVTIIKSARRKTIALKIKDGEAFIHMPTGVPTTLARNFVDEKSGWIKQKLAQQAKRVTETKTFTDGDTFYYLGQSYTLSLINENRAVSVNKTNADIQVLGRLKRLSTTAIRAAIINWYKLQADNYLSSRTKQLSEKIGLSPTSITVKTYKARWGSCSINAEIQFNWKLMLAPPAIIDYVIIHELCHIKQHNHSPAFWRLVERYYPDFKAARLWLKKHGHSLEI